MVLVQLILFIYYYYSVKKNIRHQGWQLAFGNPLWECASNDIDIDIGILSPYLLILSKALWYDHMNNYYAV